MNWLRWMWPGMTYETFMKKARDETVPISERIAFVYQHIHAFEIDLAKHKEDLYFISDLLVKNE